MDYFDYFVIEDKPLSNFSGDRSTYAPQSRTVAINTSPHYTDERFRHAQTVFGRQEDGLHYDYSDRLYEWNYKKAKRASEDASKTKARPGSANWHEAWLSSYHGKPVALKHVMAGWNWSNGYPYAVFGYRFLRMGRQ